jgi:hypothetical protein
MEEKTNPVITIREGAEGGVRGRGGEVTVEGEGVGGVVEGARGRGGEVTVEGVTEDEGVPFESLDELLSVSAINCVTLLEEGVPFESLDEVLSVSAINCVTLFEEDDDVLIDVSFMIDKLMSKKMKNP